MLVRAQNFGNAAQHLQESDKRNLKDLVASVVNRTQHDDIEYEEVYEEPGMVPDLPVINILNNGPVESGQELSASCVSKNGEPPAEIFWYLEKEALEDSTEFEEENDKTATNSVISIVKRNTTADDDNKFLICQAWHPGYSENPSISYAEAKQRLSITYKPVKSPSTKIISDAIIGDSVDVSITFKSNPKPSLVWIVDDKKVYYGTNTKKYSSREMLALGKNFWSATLRIFNLTQHDLVLNYTLQARNYLGSTAYHIKFEGI